MAGAECAGPWKLAPETKMVSETLSGANRSLFPPNATDFDKGGTETIAETEFVLLCVWFTACYNIPTVAHPVSIRGPKGVGLVGGVDTGRGADQLPLLEAICLISKVREPSRGAPGRIRALYPRRILQPAAASTVFRIPRLVF